MRSGRKKGIDPRPKMLYNEFIGNDEGREIFLKKVNINSDWEFEKEGVKSVVSLPHTWNGEDGQSRKDYYKGKCVYRKKLKKAQGVCYIEFNGANSVSEVFIDKKQVGTHRGGYSMFRFRIDGYLTEEENLLEVYVDNTVIPEVFPTSADFTFYGGIYRDVNLIYAGETRFSLDDGSREGVSAVPRRVGGEWELEIKANVTGAGTDTVCVFELKDDSGSVVARDTRPSEAAASVLKVSSPRLWDGLKDPYLYTLDCKLVQKGETVDERNILVGFREIEFSSEKGCFLNGRHIKLRGVSRHQDREGIGNALTMKEHEEDIALILEVGANAVRLAHYQQAEDFYTLCDKKGLLVWAEVPVISVYAKARQLNAEEQLISLIKQNINHPSIFCWGIQNEITLSGAGNKKMIAGIRRLNEIAHALDPSRPTACAQVAMTKPDTALNKVTDLLGYNHYFGWYVQTVNAIDKWLDNFHEVRPEAKLCLSEYGAEAVLGYYSEDPVQGDYSEGYQALYHEHYIDAIAARDRIWGSFVWNMFDFGSAARDEGGVRGRNNKGLVTIDRKIKKDAFYIYKATWSEEKFVYITAKRYPCRVIGTTKIKVYSNLPEVTLSADGYERTVKGDRVFIFDDVPVKAGENAVKVSAGGYTDEIALKGVEKLPESYALTGGAPSQIRNWFGTDGGAIRKDRFSVNDKVSEILDDKEAHAALKLLAGDIIDKWFVNLVRPFKVSTLLKIAHIDPQLRDVVNGFLQTIKKSK